MVGQHIPYIDVDDDGEDNNQGSRVAARLNEIHDFGDWQPSAQHVQSESTVASTLEEDLQIDIDIQNELDIEDNLAEEIGEVIDLTDDDFMPIRPARVMTIGSERELASAVIKRDGMIITLGTSFRIKDRDREGAEFFKVISIIQHLHRDGQQEIVLRGWKFARARQLIGELPMKKNELFLFCNMQNGCQDPWQQQSLTDLPLHAVGNIRDLHISNLPYPEASLAFKHLATHDKNWIEESDPLICRWRREAWHNPGSKKPTETALVRIFKDEADHGYRCDNSYLLKQWRGGKVPGGSFRSDSVTDLEDANLQTKLHRNQKYTAGDVFAGAGGASRGIERAGLRLLFSLDHWEPAARSLRLNFEGGGTEILECEVFDFIQYYGPRCGVDILHLSPPCQVFSPAHTTPGKDDEKNRDILLVCGHLIDKVRPRLFTVEQTFGILAQKFHEDFTALIHGFTGHGYSVRWKVITLANFGIPQTRRRLIIIGSAPGEKLPPFPQHTHSKDGIGGLPRWVTPKQILEERVGQLSAEEHKLHVKKYYAVRKAPWDPYQMAKTVTCGGGNYHWSGKRDFTKLEYAVLQGFPTWHKFHEKQVKKQIGNAFAPSVVRVFYQHLVKWLLKQDGLDRIEAVNPPPVDPNQPAVRPIRIREDPKVIVDIVEDDIVSDELTYLSTKGVILKNSVIITNPDVHMTIEGDDIAGDDPYDSSSSGSATMRGDDSDLEDAEDGTI
ncbi:S-adenosyl-L-methionine-dependent methyltransferase [Cladorrhinum sp. PSN259]|nr:S-adenosyl-L-methionine-dependent methyltransferase [Cladorrhinum sp. PSN259]